MLYLKQNDTGLGLKFELSTENGVLTTTDVDRIHFIMSDHTIDTDIIDGNVLVTFNKIHTEKVGFFNCEFKVFYIDGRIETFPNEGYLKVNIARELRRD
ncbi:hypothetical protein [Salipaludibacillus sp. CF4.18]|uniref:hypothetical protein n=1 Tax=Salipaludibacillus sp. CF4.18 TaxID=3373081 RepID=UPI003EE4D55C